MKLNPISEKYDEVWSKSKITHILIPNTGLNRLILDRDENYKELYSDSHFILYERLKVE